MALAKSPNKDMFPSVFNGSTNPMFAQPLCLQGGFISLDFCLCLSSSFLVVWVSYLLYLVHIVYRFFKFLMQSCRLMSNGTCMEDVFLGHLNIWFQIFPEALEALELQQTQSGS